MKELKDGRGLVAVSRTTRSIVNGDEDLSAWSEEELERGAKRGKDGRFRRKPTVVARAVHDELVKRRMSKAYDLLRESTYDAVATLREIVMDQEADEGVRVKAAELILDRVLGKAPMHLDISGDSKFAQLMATAIFATEEQARDAANVVEGEVVEEPAE